MPKSMSSERAIVRAGTTYSWAEFTRALTGRRAVSLAGALILIPIVFITTWVRQAGLPLDQLQVLVLVVSLIGIDALILIVAAFTYLRRRKVDLVALWKVLATYAVVGFVRPYTAALLAASWGLQTESLEQWRPWSSAVMSMIALSFVAALLDLYDRQRDASARLAQQSDELEDLRQVFEAEIVQRESDLSADIDRAVVPELEAALEQLRLIEASSQVDEIAIARIAHDLREAAEGTVRDLSHEFAAPQHSEVKIPSRTSARPKKLGWGSYLRDLFVLAPFHPVATVVLKQAISLIAVAQVFGVALGWTGLVLEGAGAYLTLTLAERWFTRSRLRATPAFLRVVVVIGVNLGAFVVGGLLAWALWIPLHGFVPTLLVQGIALGLFWALVMACIDTARIRSDDSLRAREAAIAVTAWETERQRDKLVALNRAVARRLHSDVQSSLMVAALQLEATARADGDPADIANALAVSEHAVIQALETLESTVSVALPTIDLDMSVQQVAQVWAGIVEFEIQIAPQARARIAHSSSTVWTITAIVREAVANAVRHGGAEAITIEVVAHEEHVEVMICDDGSGMAKNFSEGFGMADIRQLASGLEVTSQPGSGTQLVATVPTFHLDDLDGVSVR